MKKALLTLVDGDEHSELHKLTSWSHRIFAERHGYEYHIGGRQDRRPVSWSKITLMQLCFQGGFDRVFFIDNDAIFLRFDIDPMDILDATTASVMLAEEDNGVVNCGLWWIKNTRVGNRFLEAVDVQDWNYREPIWEQAAVHDLLGMRRGSPSVEFLRNSIFCTQFYNDMYRRVDDAVVRHYCGMKTKQRIQLVREDYAEYLDYHPDDE